VKSVPGIDGNGRCNIDGRDRTDGGSRISSRTLATGKAFDPQAGPDFHISGQEGVRTPLPG
jgi:hypothetical protein